VYFKAIMGSLAAARNRCIAPEDKWSSLVSRVCWGLGLFWILQSKTFDVLCDFGACPADGCKHVPEFLSLFETLNS